MNDLREINIDLLKPTQNCLYSDKLDGIVGTVDSKKNPLLVLHQPNGEYYIEDGHHRAYISIFQGQKNIFARVIEGSKNLYNHNYPLVALEVVNSGIKRSPVVQKDEDDGLSQLFKD